MANHAKTRLSKSSWGPRFKARVVFPLPKQFRNQIAPGSYFRADQIGSKIVLHKIDATIDDIIEEARQDYRTGNFKTYTSSKDLIEALRR